MKLADIKVGERYAVSKHTGRAERHLQLAEVATVVKVGVEQKLYDTTFQRRDGVLLTERVRGSQENVVPGRWILWTETEHKRRIGVRAAREAGRKARRAQRETVANSLQELGFKSATWKTTAGISLSVEDAERVIRYLKGERNDG